MQAIKSFVAGHHRIGDDLGLAYTLLVSSIESLAQGFDGHKTEWDDVEDRLRQAIDSALLNSEPNTADGVRNAITSNENTRLSRRFRSFAENHLPAEYFREGATGNRPIARAELSEALSQAYRLRSRYIHNILELPDALTHPHEHWETVRDDRIPHLTFQGLSRLARQVIISFVWRGQTIVAEPYPYVRESAGIATFKMAPECWVWQPLADMSHSRSRLEGFLEQLASVMAHEPNAKLTDIRSMLDDAVVLLPQAKACDRAAFIALLALWNFRVAQEHRTSNFQKLLKRYNRDSDLLVSENLIARTLLDSTNIWEIDKHIELHDDHMAAGARGKGMQLPRRLDALITLSLAERCRREGQVEKARDLVSFAVENLPGDLNVFALEQGFDPADTIDFWSALFPSPEEFESTEAADEHTSESRPVEPDGA
jgi:hypothetical protein